LPFDDETFDVVICIDVVLHLADRGAALADWARVLRTGGQLVFADAAVLTGPMSKGDIDIRASQGPLTLVPLGTNERLVTKPRGRQTLPDDGLKSARGSLRSWRRKRGTNSSRADSAFFRRRRTSLQLDDCPVFFTWQGAEPSSDCSHRPIPAPT
jgi:SAM-dependent methyltransferase